MDGQTAELTPSAINQTIKATRGKKCGILGPFGLGNLGDAATQDAVIGAIRSRWPDATIYGFSLNPEDTQLRHGIESYPIRQVEPLIGRLHWILGEATFLLRSFIRLRSFDLLVISGGGQLDDAWGGVWRQPYTLLKWALLAKISRTKLIFMSVGVGPIYSRWSAILLRWALCLANYRSFRDLKSQKLIAGIGVRQLGFVFPDLAHSLIEKSGRPPELENGKLVIGIGPMPHMDARMCPWPGPDPVKYNAYIEKLVSLIEWLHDQGRYKPLLYVGEVKHDRWVIDDILMRLRERGIDTSGNRVLVPAIETVDDLVKQLKRTHLVVASRFHGVLLPLNLECPVIALSYHPKVTELMKDTGQSEWCFDIDDVDLPTLQGAITAVERDRATISRSIATHVWKFRRSLEEQYDTLFPTGAEDSVNSL